MQPYSQSPCVGVLRSYQLIPTEETETSAYSESEATLTSPAIPKPTSPPDTTPTWGKPGAPHTPTLKTASEEAPLRRQDKGGLRN